MTDSKSLSRKNLHRNVSLLLAALIALRVVFLILLPHIDTSESRYAEISRKMVETGDWITPQFDYGIPFWAKPPLVDVDVRFGNRIVRRERIRVANLHLHRRNGVACDRGRSRAKGGGQDQRAGRRHLVDGHAVVLLLLGSRDDGSRPGTGDDPGDGGVPDRVPYGFTALGLCALHRPCHGPAGEGAARPGDGHPADHGLGAR